ncbi:50S ribosomal protein L30 [Desulfovibrio sp. UCD-KL4C]|uniref:50S ribosomal protein L30 n=1 Tax=Desulfovibrio sp. UCD-KL4C TaxID=2578120 RepID=UPI0025B7CB20|nr:50S ribosomal protein L30 [Desulfovibrio sp. UCD-KL4C]
MLKVKLIRSKIGCNPKQRKTLVAMGLRKIRQERSFEDSLVIRGMINKVSHLVEVSES